jgi:sugar O-acyltransferase (sialic acid O-acetyltransferase NeuD family)
MPRKFGRTPISEVSCLHVVPMQSSREILVLGGGGHGKSVVAMVLASGHTAAGVLDDDPALWGTRVQGVPVLGPIDPAAYAGAEAVLGVGRNASRIAVVERCAGMRWTRILYPHTYVNPTAEIGEGTVIFPGALVGADARLGAHVIMNGHTCVGHDTVLEDFVHVAAGVQIAGGVHVGRGAMLGIGSVVTPGIRIGAGAIVAAGAVVVRDVAAGTSVLGVPARARVAVPDDEMRGG